VWGKFEGRSLFSGHVGMTSGSTEGERGDRDQQRGKKRYRFLRKEFESKSRVNNHFS